MGFDRKLAAQNGHYHGDSTPAEASTKNEATSLYASLVEPIAELVNNTFKGTRTTIIIKEFIDYVEISIEDNAHGIDDLTESMKKGGEGQDDGIFNEWGVGMPNAINNMMGKGNLNSSSRRTFRIATRTIEDMRLGRYQLYVGPYEYIKKVDYPSVLDVPYPGREQEPGTYIDCEVSRKVFLDTENILNPTAIASKKGTFESNVRFIKERIANIYDTALNSFDLFLEAYNLNGELLEELSGKIERIDPLSTWADKLIGPVLKGQKDVGHYVFDGLTVKKDGKKVRLKGKLIIDFYQKKKSVRDTVFEHRASLRHQGGTYRMWGYKLLEYRIDSRNCASHGCPHPDLNHYEFNANWCPEGNEGRPLTKVNKTQIDEADYVIPAIDEIVMGIMPVPEKYLEKEFRRTEYELNDIAKERMEQNGLYGVLQSDNPEFKNIIVEREVEVGYSIKEMNDSVKLPHIDILIKNCETMDYVIVESKKDKEGTKSVMQLFWYLREIYYDTHRLPKAIYIVNPNNLAYVEACLRRFKENPESYICVEQKDFNDLYNMEAKIISWSDIGVNMDKDATYTATLK